MLRYFRFVGTARPSEKALTAFYESLDDMKVVRGTRNNKFAITDYYRMMDKKVNMSFFPIDKSVV